MFDVLSPVVAAYREKCQLMTYLLICLFYVLSDAGQLYLLWRIGFVVRFLLQSGYRMLMVPASLLMGSLFW